MDGVLLIAFGFGLLVTAELAAVGVAAIVGGVLLLL